jgi:hypothetical protein
MRKYTLLVALVSAIFATALTFPNRADALTFSAPAGALNAAAAVDVAQPEQVYWRYGGRRLAYSPRPYYYGYYQPWPYYAYYPYGSYNYYYPYWGW